MTTTTAAARILAPSEVSAPVGITCPPPLSFVIVFDAPPPADDQ
jgi:hypothetical protein